MADHSENARADIIRLIASNRDAFQAEQIEALFVVTAEDLVLGGLDHIRVEASMMRAWVRMQIAQRGAVRTAEVLRDFADRVERPALINSQPSGRAN